MGVKFILAICFFMLLACSNANSEIINLPESDNTKIRGDIVTKEDIITEAPKTEYSFIQITPDNNTKNEKIEQSKEKPSFINIQVEENIFNKSFKKEFKTGIIKDIEPIACQDFTFTGIRASNGNAHTLFDNQVGVYGFKGHFRDGTLFGFSMLPFMDAPSYHNFKYRIFEYYLRKNIDKHNSITIGQQRTPVGYEGTMPSGLAVGRRAQFASMYSNVAAIGSKIIGDYDRIEYDLGVFDAGRVGKNTFKGSEFAGRVSLKPIKNPEKHGKLKIGGSYNVGKLDYSYSVYSGHVVYDYKKFHTLSEYSYADGHNGYVNSGARSYGYYTTFMYDITPKIRAFSRMDTLNANTSLNGQTCTEYTAGLHYYFKGLKKARLTLSYVFAQKEGNIPDTSKIFSMFEILL